MKKALLLAIPAFILCGNLLAQKCKKTPNPKDLNIACDLVVDRGVCLFNGQKVVLNTSIGEASEVKTVEVEMVVSDCKGNTKALTGTASLNATSGDYDATLTLPDNKGCTWALDSFTLKISNTCGDKFVYGQSAKLAAPFTNFAILLNGMKRPPKYGQCMVFSKAAGKGDNFVKLDDFTISAGDSVDAITKKPVFAIVLAINNTKKSEPTPLEEMLMWGSATATAYVELETDKGKTFTVTAKPVYNKGIGRYTFDEAHGVDASSSYRILSFSMDIQNSCKETFALEGEYKSAGPSGTTDEIWDLNQDGCDNHMKIESAVVEVTRNSGLYAAKFVFTQAAKNSGDNLLVLNVEITNCKGEVKYVEMKATFSQSKGVWTATGSFVIADEKDCKWKITDLSMKAYNACGTQINKDGFPKLIQKMKDKIAKGDV